MEQHGTAAVVFLPNQWKHAAGLRIEYTGVTQVSVDYGRSIDWMEAITVLLDEVRPDGAGVVHDIGLTDATITVRCAGLTATWG